MIAVSFIFTVPRFQTSNILYLLSGPLRAVLSSSTVAMFIQLARLESIHTSIGSERGSMTIFNRFSSLAKLRSAPFHSKNLIDLFRGRIC